MNTDIDRLTEKLRSNRLMRTDEEVAKFEEALAAIYEQGDINLIPNLCVGLDDATNHHEVTFGIVHAIEDFYNDESKRQFNEILVMVVENDLLLPQAKEWLKIIILRTLNDDDATDTLAVALKDAQPHAKAVIKTQVEELIEEDARQFEVNGKKLIIDY